jgi:ADP-ribosylglycohydrolase
VTTLRDRAEGALLGLAIGDALGMPTQTLSRQRILSTTGPIQGFLPAPPEHPIARGLPAGAVTDDTEQALLLADVVIAGGGRIDPRLLAERLAAWEDDMRARGSADLLGPSTRSAVAAVLAGVPPEQAGRHGATNGAAMRIAPIGLVQPAGDLPALVDRVAEACLVSHDTSIAIAGAAAVAAAVSGALDGLDHDECVALAVRAAALGARRGHWTAGADVATRIEAAVSLVRTVERGRAPAEVLAQVGTSLATQESVPAAFAMLALHPLDPWAACCEAASLGGDTDTIAAMAGAMGGARTGAAGFPAYAVGTVLEVNALDLGPRVDALLALR